MDQTTVINLAREALVTAIMVAGPLLLLGVAVGLLVSIIQTATSIQEQTLTFVPKILAVLFAIVAFGPGLLSRLITFTKSLLGHLTYFVG
jgi:flagellar biosynthetic protein FliQ